LNDADPAVRLKAIAALANIGKDAREAADDLKELFQNVNEPALLVAVMDALAAIGGLERSLVDQLLASKGLKHADVAVRCKALDSLQRLGLDTLRIRTLAELHLDDANSEVRDRAAKVLTERMDHLSDEDMEDVRALLGMTDKPKAVQIALEAVKHRGPKAKEVLPELLKRLPDARGKHKLELALALAAIDAKDTKVAKSIIPVLVAALRPATEKEQPNEAVLKSIAAIGEPVVDEIFKALEAAEGIGNINANNRKALFLALEQLGPEAYSERNLRLLREYRGKERYRDVQQAAGRAIKAMLP
jgi:hypothetical protein